MNLTKEERMANGSIPGLIVSMSVPAIIAQVINVLYNIVDRIYIGHIPGVGAAALTGVGLTFPIAILISAFSAFASSGGAPLSAIWLGKGDRDHAEKILGSSLWLLLVFTVVLMAVFYAFHVPFLYAFGASDETLPYAASYLRIYLAGTLFVELALGISPFIMRSTECLINIVMNRQLQVYGNDLYVGSMTIMQSIMQFMSAPLAGFTQGIQPTFLALGQARISLFIAMLRKVILLVPLALIFPLFWGVQGIYYAEPVSDILSVTVASALFLRNINRILSRETLERIA